MRISEQTRRRYKEAVIDSDATDVFLAPELPGNEAYVWYDRDGKINLDELPCSIATLKRSGFKYRLHRLPKRDSGRGFQWTWIIGRMYNVQNNQWFVAQEIRVSDDSHQAHGMNRLHQLNWLHHRGILTVLPLCSWLSVTGVNRDKSACLRPLTKDRQVLAAQLTDRLKATVEVLYGMRDMYWQAPMRKHLSNEFGGLRVPIKEPERLEVAAAVGPTGMWIW